jgi:hypothetical protein
MVCAVIKYLDIDLTLELAGPASTQAFARALVCTGAGNPFKPDDHSEVVPLLPIPNRTVKRLSADDSADSRVKVGHRQANIRVKRRAFVRRFYL